MILRGDRILAAGPAARVTVPRGARRVDLRGKWITPGLIDAHVHFSQSGGLYTRPDAVDLRSTMPYEQDLARTKALDETFARYLASGVTAVVDAGGPMWNFDVARRAAVPGTKGPRVAVAGPLIATEPTPDQQRLNLGDPPIHSATDAADAARLARAQLQHKPAFIKLWGIGSGEAGAKRVREMTRAVADVAHPAGVRVAVHATELLLARAAVEGGADILVHSVEDAALPPDFVQLLADRKVVSMTTAMVHEGYRDAFFGNPQLLPIERSLGAPDIVATLQQMPGAIVDRVSERYPPEPVPQVLANVRLQARAGVRLAAGTDAGNIGTLHGPAIHRELQLLAQAGLTPAQVLVAATRDAAFAFAAKPDIGLVAPGYRADLLVLNADPLAQVANLQRIAAVWSKGSQLDPATLLPPTPESIVQRQLERYNAHDIDGFLSTYAEDATLFDSPGAARPMASGKVQMRGIYSKLFAEAKELHCRAAQRMVEGPFVIDQEVCWMAPGRPPVSAAAIYEVRDGLIRRVWFAAAEPPKAE